MKNFLKEIPKNHTSYKNVREIYEFEDIEITVLQNRDKITILGFNYKSQRFLNLGSKKYSSLITGFKEIAKDIYVKDGKYYITLSDSIKSVISNKIIGYCRVSTKGQLEGNSLEEQSTKILGRYSNAEIIEESYSGAKERPIFNKMLKSLNNGDTLVVTKLDRFCRTTKEGLQYIDLLMNKGIKIHILNMGLIEDTPMGRLIVTNLLAFAEFERAMIIERTQSGKAIAKAKAEFKEGRPKKHTKEQLDHALAMLSINGGDKSYTEVERLLGISKSTLIRENNKRKALQL